MQRRLFFFFFFFNDTATTEIYTLSLHDALPISAVHDLESVAVVDGRSRVAIGAGAFGQRGEHVEHGDGSRRERLRSEEHTSELQSLAYLVCRLLLEKKKKQHISSTPRHHPTRRW